jgi:hypothetical protein
VQSRSHRTTADASNDRARARFVDAATEERESVCKLRRRLLSE